jgi:hypothetical protein
MMKTPSNSNGHRQSALKSADFFISPNSKTLINLRGIALVLSVFMILQDVAWAYPDKAVSAPAALAGPAASIAIPGAMGRVEQSFDAASGRAIVINVRDAHRKLNSQYSISRLLAHLADEYQMDFVAMEGSSGPVHTGLLAALPDHAARDKMADSLLRNISRSPTAGRSSCTAPNHPRCTPGTKIFLKKS